MEKKMCSVAPIQLMIHLIGLMSNRVITILYTEQWRERVLDMQTPGKCAPPLQCTSILSVCPSVLTRCLDIGPFLIGHLLLLLFSLSAGFHYCVGSSCKRGVASVQQQGGKRGGVSPGFISSGSLPTLCTFFQLKHCNSITFN